ncbi:DNA-binding response regulator [Fibrobacterota bacterium]
MSEDINVVICEDHPKVIEVWENMLSREPRIKIIGNFLTAEEYLGNVSVLSPSVIIMNVWFGAEPVGFDLLEWTRKTLNVPVIMASIHRDDLIKSFKMGAISFLYKAEYDDPTRAVVMAAEGKAFFPEDIHDLLEIQLQTDSRWEKLTHMEKYIIRMRLRGFTKEEIAEAFKTSIEKHVQQIRVKLGMNLEEILTRLS